MASPRSTAAMRPLHPLLVPIPIACFVGTFISEIALAATAEPQWAELSSWLLAIGLVVAFVAAIVGVMDFLWEPKIRALPNTWIHVIGNAIALLLAMWNALIHSHRGDTGMSGLVLSASVVVILAISGWNGWSLVHHHGVGREGLQ